jgi:hypothetical protein
MSGGFSGLLLERAQRTKQQRSWRPTHNSRTPTCPAAACPARARRKGPVRPHARLASLYVLLERLTDAASQLFSFLSVGVTFLRGLKDGRTNGQTECTRQQLARVDAGYVKANTVGSDGGGGWCMDQIEIRCDS